MLVLQEVPPASTDALRRRVSGQGPPRLRQRDADLHLQRVRHQVRGVAGPGHIEGSTDTVGCRQRPASPCPAGQSGPWSWRTGAPKASSTGRERKALPRRVRGLPTMPYSLRGGPHPPSRLEPEAQGMPALSSPAVPLACHSHQSRPVTCEQPRTTQRQLQPASLPVFAGDDPGRSGFGSRGSPA
jgi:hypothetical protein